MNLEADLYPLANGDTPLVRRLSLHSNQTINFDLGAVWEDICGNFFSEASYWVESYKFEGIDKTKENPKWSKDAWNPDYKVTITHDEVDGKTKKTLTANDLAQAFAKLTFDGWAHCGGCTIDDPDACVVDAVLQQAIFGEQVFG
jgi:hypothetical protein